MFVLENQKQVNELQKSGYDVLHNISQLMVGGWDKINNEAIQNDIQNIEVMDRCTGLSKLYFRGVQLTTLNKYQVIKQIKELKIVGCKKITNFQFLKKCDQVEQFGLHDMNIKNINIVLYLKSLKELQINNCFYITNFSALSKCAGLEALVIWRTSIADISPIIQLDNLNLLYINENNNLPKEFQDTNILKSEQINQLYQKWKQTKQIQNKLKKQNIKLGSQNQDQTVLIQQLKTKIANHQKTLKELEESNEKELEEQKYYELLVENQFQVLQQLQVQIKLDQQQIADQIQNIEDRNKEQISQLQIFIYEQKLKYVQNLQNIQDQNQLQIDNVKTLVQEQNHLQDQIFQEQNQKMIVEIQASIVKLHRYVNDEQNRIIVNISKPMNIIQETMQSSYDEQTSVLIE